MVGVEIGDIPLNNAGELKDMVNDIVKEYHLCDKVCFHVMIFKMKSLLIIFWDIEDLGLYPTSSSAKCPYFRGSNHS